MKNCVYGLVTKGCCIPHEELCVWAGYDQLQAYYPAHTPLSKDSHL